MSKKVAIVCDWLTSVGGGEKVVLAVHELYPDAPIYTSQYRPEKVSWFDHAEVKTGWINHLPLALKRFVPFLRNWHFSGLNMQDYDLVISITGAESKAVKTRPDALHVSYMHAPTQYYWTLHDQYMENPGFGKLNPLVRLALKILVGPLRKADYAFAQRPDVVVSNSTYIQGEIKKFYGRDSTVIFPNVDTQKTADLVNKFRTSETKVTNDNPFIIYGRHVSWKRMDIAVKAAMLSESKLLVIGEGPETANLKQLAEDSPYIEFMPRFNGLEEVAERVINSRAFLFPSIEPFGIAPVEALGLGTPVIAFKGGGALDIVQEGVNGVFFSEQTAESLASVMREFDTTQFDSRKVQESAERFSEKNFKEQITALINESEKK